MTAAQYAPRRAGLPGNPDAGPAAGAATPTRRPPAGHGRHIRRIRLASLLAADVIAVAIAAAVCGGGLARGAGYGLAALVALAVAGQYRQRIGQRVSDQAGRLALAASLAVLVLLSSTAVRPALLLAAAAAGLVVAGRAVASAGLRAASRRGMLTRQTLIIGGGRPACLLARLLRAHPELGLHPRGMLDNRPSDAGLPLLGSLSDAAAVLARFDITQVLVCFPTADDAELVRVLRTCRERGAQVSVLPRLPELGAAVPRACLDDIWGVLLVPLRPDPLAAVSRAAKRALDLSAGSVLLMLTAPLMLALALAVWLDLHLPPLFRQVRVVGPGRLATITKLRTLRPAGDPDTTWAVTGHCSALGRLLRSTHADELPQLVSVLRGAMSLVGPRPERPHFSRQLARDISGYADRERVSAGLTGWAQVHGMTGDTCIEDRARFDNSYIEYQSVWLDLLILARTVPSALTGALRSARGGTQ